MPHSFWKSNLIYNTIAGSRAYGLETPTSDVDERGVCIPSRPCLLGLEHFEQWEQKDGQGDAVIYALKKFVRLALDCNPNIIELLYVDEDKVLFSNYYGDKLRAQRHIFLSRRARQTFAGYAISQLRRIQRHHRWLVNPPQHKPLQSTFGGQLVAGRYKFPDQDAEKAYHDALKHWNQYKSWQHNRNPARAELERRYGYDTKHAMHLLRLLKMGAELLETGQLQVYRPDREWLRSVREGALTYEELLRLAAQHEAHLDLLHENSPLPAEPDSAAAEDLVITLHERFLWNSRRED